MVKCTIAALLFLAAIAVEPASSQTVLLDFWSPECGPCRQMLPTIDQLVAAGYPVRRVDVTAEPQLAQQLNVKQVPCFVMLVDGREVDRVVGAVDQTRLVQMFPPARPQAAPAVAEPIEPAAIRSQSPDAVAGNDPWSSLGRTAPAPENSNTPARLDEHAALLISSSVRLKVEDAKGHSYGTGTIIDTRSGEALIITCGHLFRDSQGKGSVTVELFAVTPQGVRVVDQVAGHVVSHNVDREIGLVSIKANVPVRIAPIAATQTVMARGDRVTSIGCDNGKDPSALNTRVTATNRYQGPPNIEAQGAPVEGRSGGGLFNTAGELVGVCFAADYEGNEGLYTALESIHDELDRLGLTEVYQKTASAAGPTAAQQAAAPVVRGQEPTPPAMAVPESFTPPTEVALSISPQGSSATPAGLNEVERAAWDEIMARAADSEVICIIRPKQPGGKSEVITLDSVSPQFVQGLAERTGAVPAIRR